ncbi:MAG: hypothetical protein HYZ22_01180 [Chloroflexi bacterium]|nr:hypothetical protein [Chloroflexota bacterium]
MNIKKYPFLFLLSTLLILSLACSSLADFSATATPLPTMTFTPPPPTPTPAGPVSSTGGPIVASVGGLELSNERYSHPNGFVSFYPMKGWEIYETENSVVLTHPDTSVGFSINVNNTGYRLDAEAYANFRNNAEEFYKVFDGYTETNSGTNEAIQLYFVEKTYTFFDGSEYYTNSIYQQIGSVIYTMELYGESQYVSADEFNPYRIMFDSFLQTVEVHSDIASEFPLYQQTWDYTALDAPATITVPWTWTFTTYSTDAGTSAFFESPDNTASAGILTFTTVNLVGDAGKNIGLDLALTYLESAFSSNINITTEGGGVNDFQPGAYVFSWEAPSNQNSGVVIYDTRVKNKLIMVVLEADTGVFAMYSDVLGKIGDSYTLDQ